MFCKIRSFRSTLSSVFDNCVDVLVFLFCPHRLYAYKIVRLRLLVVLAEYWCVSCGTIFDLGSEFSLNAWGRATLIFLLGSESSGSGMIKDFLRTLS